MLQLFQSLRGTEDQFLIGWFLLLLIALSGCIGGAWYVLAKSNWKLHRIYFMTVFLMGLIFMLALPPLSAPDEILHFAGSYALSNQLMGQKVRDENGNVIIRKEDEYIVNWPGDDDPCKATVLGQMLSRPVYRAMHEKGFWPATVEGDGITLQQPVKTTPFAYLLPALGITLARLLHLSAVGLVLLGRFMNLLMFSVLSMLAIRRIPVGKEILFAVSLFPMTLELAGSYSYDSYIIALSFCLISVVLDLALTQPDAGIRRKDVLTLAALSVLLSPCKMIYATLFLLCFLIPLKKWGQRPWGKWLLSVGLIGLLIVGSILLVNLREVTRYINASGVTQAPEYTSSGAVNTVKLHDLTELVHDPTLIFRIIRNTLGIMGGQYLGTMVGMWLGAMDMGLDISVPMLVLFWGITILLSLVGQMEEPVLSLPKRLWMLLTVLLLSFVLMTSLLLALTPADTFYILGIQGRYFLPYLPVLLLIFRLPGRCFRRLQLQTDLGRTVGFGLLLLMDAAVLLHAVLVVLQRTAV